RAPAVLPSFPTRRSSDLKGVILPKYRGDLLACAALTEQMRAGAVEPRRMPRNPLDVLAQQIVAMVATDEWEVDQLEEVVRRAAPDRKSTRLNSSHSQISY